MSRPAQQDAQLVQLEEILGVHHLVLCRAEKRNAINRDMYDAATRHVSSLKERNVRVAVLRSVGPVFCAGADLTELASGFNAPVMLAELLISSGIFWIAQVEGGALGAGVALVSGCHAAIGTADAWFSLPELSRGFYPEPVIQWAEGRGLSRRWLHGLAVTCRRVTASEAVANGLLTGLVPDGQNIDGEIRDLVRRLQAAENTIWPIVEIWPNATTEEGLDAGMDSDRSGDV